MPTFTAIALDRLLEPGASKSVDKTMPRSNPIPKSKSFSETKPAPTPKLERRSSTTIAEKKSSIPPLSPALYATPKATPLPDSPSSYTPSPYIINHKRRGPRLLKSASKDDVASQENNSPIDDVNGAAKDSAAEIVDSSTECPVSEVISDHAVTENLNNGLNNLVEEESAYDVHNGSIRGDGTNVHYSVETKSSDLEPQDGILRSNLIVGNNLGSNVKGDAENDYFFGKQESMSYTSNTDVEDHTGADSSTKRAATAPMGEFFDAWEELSSESGQSASLRDIEAELREMRLSLLMEIEKRKQAEEALNSLQGQWQRIKEQLSTVGFTFPACPCAVSEGEQEPAVNPAEELCQQVYFARFVSESIGKGTARAEMEVEMDAQIEAKNSEIARMLDRLNFYEAVNREMYQRNQEAVESARRNRQLKKRRQRWAWGSIAAVLTLGTAALAWYYFPSGMGSSPTSVPLASDNKDTSE